MKNNKMRMLSLAIVMAMLMAFAPIATAAGGADTIEVAPISTNTKQDESPFRPFEPALFAYNGDTQLRMIDLAAYDDINNRDFDVYYDASKLYTTSKLITLKANVKSGYSYSFSMTDTPQGIIQLNSGENGNRFSLAGAGMVFEADASYPQVVMTVRNITTGETKDYRIFLSNNENALDDDEIIVPETPLGNIPGGAVTGEITAPEAILLAKEALDAADEDDDLVVSVSGSGTFPLESMTAAVDVVDERPLTVQADTLAANGGVILRMSWDAAKATEDIAFGGSTLSAEAQQVKTLFGGWYENDVAVVSLDQKGTFGTTVSVAAKADISSIDTDDIVLYAYDRTANTVRKLADQSVRVDANGYLHFNTTEGGVIIVSEGELTKK